MTFSLVFNMRVTSSWFRWLFGNSIKTGNPHFFQVRCQIKSKLLQLRADFQSRTGRVQPVDLHRKLTQVLHPKLTHLEEPEYGSILSGFSSFDRLRLFRRAVFEAVAVVAGLDDMTVMRQSVQ